ncbi:MAG: uracil-DNA glycosylase [bacterium]|nr:uracil-DNA glycosylase [bacterium]
MNEKDYKTLEDIAADIAVCKKCPLHETRAKTVPGAGSPQARLMFIGEGPGEKEDLQGLPFIGRSGKLLTQSIEEMGLTRDEVFITSIVKCRPPQNRNPSKAEITACKTYLQAQLDAIAPKIICALGLPATRTLLGSKEGIGKLRGKWFDYKGIKLMPTFHPAYLLRSQSKIVDTRKDLQEIMRVYREVT